MKTYKDYMDRIQVSGEQHQRFVKALMQTEALPAEGEKTADKAKNSSSAERPKRMWWKKKWIPLAASAAVFALVIWIGVGSMSSRSATITASAKNDGGGSSPMEDGQWETAAFSLSSQTQTTGKAIPTQAFTPEPQKTDSVPAAATVTGSASGLTPPQEAAAEEYGTKKASVSPTEMVPEVHSACPEGTAATALLTAEDALVEWENSDLILFEDPVPGAARVYVMTKEDIASFTAWQERGLLKTVEKERLNEAFLEKSLLIRLGGSCYLPDEDRPGAETEAIKETLQRIREKVMP